MKSEGWNFHFEVMKVEIFNFEDFKVEISMLKVWFWNSMIEGWNFNAEILSL